MYRKQLKQTVLISLSSLLLFACGNGEEEIEESPEPDTTETTDLEEENTNETDDGSTEGEEVHNGNTHEDDEEGNNIEDDSLANMSEEERREHYMTMMVDPDTADEQVFENLELRGVHENTVAYGGRVRPGASIELTIQDRRSDIDSTDELYVNEDGFFAMNLRQYENVEGDEINLMIDHEEFEQPQEFVLQMHGVADDMEIITPVSDTSEYEEELLNSLDLDGLPTFYPNTIITRGYLDRHLEGFFYSFDEEEPSDAFMVLSQRDNDEGQVTIAREDYPQAGQQITYHAVGDGVIASTEDSVEEMTAEAEQAAETIRNETDIPFDESTSGETIFETVPNAEIALWNPEMEVRTTRVSDENGEVEFHNPEEYNEAGTMLYVTIRDEAGYTETIEIDF